MHCLYGGYNLHQFSDALGLVKDENRDILIFLHLGIPIQVQSWPP